MHVDMVKTRVKGTDGGVRDQELSWKENWSIALLKVISSSCFDVNVNFLTCLTVRNLTSSCFPTNSASLNGFFLIIDKSKFSLVLSKIVSKYMEINQKKKWHNKFGYTEST